MQSKTTAKDFFLYLAGIIGLYVSTVSYLVLVFSIVDKLLPLTGGYTLGYDGSIRSSLAVLIIFFPAFFYISWLIYKDLKNNPDKKEIWVRKWTIYSTLFISGLTIAIDLAILLYRFLGAEDVTLRFFLKVFFVLASAMVIFRYYFYELKRKPEEYTKIMKLRILMIATVRIIAILIGIILIGSPAMQRAKNLDQQRVTDLAGIQSQIVYTQWQNTGTIPTTLLVLNDSISGYIVPVDPQTNAEYGYTKISSTSFELCADFAAPSDANTPYATTVGRPVADNWQHTAGHVCFLRTIDPTLYKVIPATVPVR